MFSPRVGEKSIRYTNTALNQRIDILILSLFTSWFYKFWSYDQVRHLPSSCESRSILDTVKTDIWLINLEINIWKYKMFSSYWKLSSHEADLESERDRVFKWLKRSKNLTDHVRKWTVRATLLFFLCVY